MSEPFCPACGSPDTRQTDPILGPGEVSEYRCEDCGERFEAIVPEPPDDYLGDGVFAENH
jgi:transposase-like protein